MNITEIISQRKYGHIWIRSTSTFSLERPSFVDVLSHFNLQPKPEALKVIDVKEAVNIIADLLHKDMAYDAECMAKDISLHRGDYLISQFYVVGATIYTNRRWNYEQSQLLNSWNSMTESTFDAGVIIRTDKISTCIWAEDED